MDERKNHKILVDRYLSKKATDEELAVFFKLAGEGKLDDLLHDAFNGNEPLYRDTGKVKHIPAWKTIAVAASIVVIAAAGLLFFFDKNNQTQKQGTVVSTKDFINLKTPKGRQQQYTLPDGSKVWLNAASSLHYPKQFTAIQRVVELDGECYFEVAHDASKPFHVQLGNNTDIEVLGTHFTVYAYKNEKTNATLLEGKIKIKSGEDSAILHPGQQVLVQNNGKMEVAKADTSQALAWKNGVLEFHGADVSSVMRQIERWYDIEVVYTGKVPQRQLAGKIPVSTDILDVLKILELSNVHCRLDGRTMTVLEE